MPHFFYPEHSVSVEAENQPEADEKLSEIIKEKELSTKTEEK